MKKVLYIFVAAAAAFLAGCTRTELDPLEGIFTPPTIVELSTLQNVEAFKDEDGRRIFVMDFSDGSTLFHATLVGDKYYLTENTYSEALDVVAKKGNFIIGETSVASKNIKQGNITVTLVSETETEEGTENVYSINAVLFADDGTPYKLSWTGKMAFEKDAVLDPEYFYTIAAPAAVTDANNNVVEGVKSNVVTLKDKNGDFAAQFSFILADGVTEIAGDYTVKEYASEPYTAGNGFDFSIYGWDLVIGSYYKQDGANVIINPGETIKVTAMGNGLYTIDGSTGYSFFMAPEGYDPNAVILNHVVSVANYYEMYGGFSHTLGINLANGDVASSFDMTTYTTNYSGSGDMLKLEVYTVDGKLAPGTYKASADPANLAEGEFGTGYVGTYGDSGTTWYEVSGGTLGSPQFITDGTVTISADGDIVTVKIESSLVTATYTGKIDGVSIAGGEEPPQPGTEDVTLTDFLSLTSYLNYGVNLVGVELATSGFSYTSEFDWSTFTNKITYSGDGRYLKLELYSTDGNIAPGTYKACAVGGTVGEGEFGIGYDGQMGVSGTTWYTIVDNAETHLFVTDGTVEVSKEGDVYTIVVSSSVLNAKYEGKLSK